MTDPLIVLFEDAHCLAVVKPSGLPIQSMDPGEPTLEAAVRRHLSRDDPGGVYVGTVHRLDRPVTGVALWAKTPKAARRLADQFSGREVHKEYWAVVEGHPAANRGLWDDWLCLDRETGLGRVQVCSRLAPRAKQAVTRYERGEGGRLPEGCCWLRLWPETGRTHQLRAQASSRSLPILGDRTYGAAGPFPSGIALHARSLTIRHPVLHRPMTFTAPLPESWREAGIVLPASP